MHPGELEGRRQNLYGIDENNYVSWLAIPLPDVVPPQEPPLPANNSNHREDEDNIGFRKKYLLWIVTFIEIFLGIIGIAIAALTLKHDITNGDSKWTTQVLAAFTLMGATAKIIAGSILLMGLTCGNEAFTISTLQCWNLGTCVFGIECVFSFSFIIHQIVEKVSEGAMEMVFDEAIFFIGCLIDTILGIVSIYFTHKFKKINSSLIASTTFTMDERIETSVSTL